MQARSHGEQTDRAGVTREEVDIVHEAAELIFSPLERGLASAEYDPRAKELLPGLVNRWHATKIREADRNTVWPGARLVNAFVHAYFEKDSALRRLNKSEGLSWRSSLLSMEVLAELVLTFPTARDRKDAVIQAFLAMQLDDDELKEWCGPTRD